MTLRTSYVRPLWRGALDRWHGKRARWARPYITTHTPALRSAHIALEARSRRAGLWDARTHHKLLYGSRAIGAAAAPAGFHLRRGGGRPRRRAHARAYPLILTDLRGWDRPDFRPRQSYVMLSCPILWFSHHWREVRGGGGITAGRVLVVFRLFGGLTYLHEGKKRRLLGVGPLDNGREANKP